MSEKSPSHLSSIAKIVNYKNNVGRDCPFNYEHRSLTHQATSLFAAANISQQSSNYNASRSDLNRSNSRAGDGGGDGDDSDDSDS